MPYFRPHLSFTLLVLPLLAVLVGLGVWQIERLHWKLGLIAEMNHNIALPPLAFDQAVKLGDKAQYHRVRLTGHFENGKEAYVFTTGPDGGPAYHVITPFAMDDGRTMLVDRGFVPTNLRDPATRPKGELSGERTVVGVWRTPDPPTLFTARPDPAHRVWYARDLKAIAEADDIVLAAPVIVEADAKPNPGGWPKGGQTVVDLPNNHLSYAVTWFGLAWALVCIYFAWHISRGRLGLRRKA